MVNVMIGDLRPTSVVVAEMKEFKLNRMRSFETPNLVPYSNIIPQVALANCFPSPSSMVKFQHKFCKNVTVPESKSLRRMKSSNLSSVVLSWSSSDLPGNS